MFYIRSDVSHTHTHKITYRFINGPVLILSISQGTSTSVECQNASFLARVMRVDVYVDQRVFANDPLLALGTRKDQGGLERGRKRHHKPQVIYWGEAHATLAQLLVLMEIPGELGSIITNRVVAISCNECPTEELRMTCGCVGNTGFNTVPWPWVGRLKSTALLRALEFTCDIAWDSFNSPMKWIVKGVFEPFHGFSKPSACSHAYVIHLVVSSKQPEDRFLDWAAKNLPPLARPRRIAVVEESYLVRRVAATVLGRLQGFGRQTVHNHTKLGRSSVLSILVYSIN